MQAPANLTLCIVLTNDKGFDPLLRHLNAAGVACERIGTKPVAAAAKAPAKPKPAPKPTAQPAVNPANMARVLEVLGKSEKKSRPRKHKTLVQAVHSLFQKKISKAEVEAIISSLIADKKISESAGAVTYGF